MGFPQDKVKLLVDEPEPTPTFSEEEEDDFDDGIGVCRFMFVLMVYVLVLGIFLSASTYHGVKHEGTYLERGGRRYYLQLFKHESVRTIEQRRKAKRDKEQQLMTFADFTTVKSFVPPPRSEKAKTARYIVHNSIWGSISTISVSLNGAPFGVVMSFSDGTVDNSTGVPYFYLAAVDPVVQNIKLNPWASLSLSLAQSDYCKTHNWDPEEPLCSRVTVTGKLVHVGHDELKFAQNALFTRHPVMKTWPKDHDWQTLRLGITNVWLQDNYGSADIIPVKDYFNVTL